MQHRRSHTTEAIAQIQNEQSLLVAGAAAGTVMPVPGIKKGDYLKSVSNVSAAPPVPEDPSDFTIYEPQAFATYVVGGTAFAVDSYVEIGGLKFIFTDRPGNLVEDNYPVGSNSSNRYYVPFAGVAATDLQALVDAVNAAYQTDDGGVLAGVRAVVDGVDMKVTALAYQEAGEVVTVGKSADLTGGEWQDSAAAATDTLKLDPADAEGIVSGTVDLSLATDVEVVWQPYQNNDTIDKAELEDSAQGPVLGGLYNVGDKTYDNDPAQPADNVGYGPGRMPPGWQYTP